MSASEEFIAYVRELLLPLGPLKSGKFFGGFAFKSGHRQFAMIMDNTLYFRVNEETRLRYKQEGMKPFSYATKKGRVEVHKYYSVPDYLLEEPDGLLNWAKDAIDASYGSRSRA